MKTSIPFLTTGQFNSNRKQLRQVLQELFIRPEPENIMVKIISFLRQYPLLLEEFPRQDHTYVRTIIYREKNGYEAMAARWSLGAASSIHGHPPFLFYYVIKGSLKIDNYRRDGAGITLNSSELVRENEHFFSIGKPGRYDNNIHQVRANEETLSFHVSSDDLTKSAVFHKSYDMALEY